jgi:hypothetical protein
MNSSAHLSLLRHPARLITATLASSALAVLPGCAASLPPAPTPAVSPAPAASPKNATTSNGATTSQKGAANANRVASSALDDYVARPEPLFAWREVSTHDGITELEVTSQQWQGTTWKHRVEIIRPQKLEFPDRALLVINYGSGDAAASAYAQLAANATGAWLVNLWNVPNQPLWGHSEDDLIAHTFTKYFETGDPTWPLLLPMTKSALQTMKAVESWSKQPRGAASPNAAPIVGAATENARPLFQMIQARLDKLVGRGCRSRARTQ